MTLGLASLAYGQDVMTLKECMQYAVENSAKMKLQQMDVDDANSGGGKLSVKFLYTFVNLKRKMPCNSHRRTPIT